MFCRNYLPKFENAGLYFVLILIAFHGRTNDGFQDPIHSFRWISLGMVSWAFEIMDAIELSMLCHNFIDKLGRIVGKHGLERPPPTDY